QFDDVEVVRHFWPMVRSESHLDRIMAEVQASPGMILFTLVNGELRASLERRAGAHGLPTVAALDAVTDALSRMLGQEAKARPGRQHVLDRRSEEHTSELQSRENLVCRLLLEKKKKIK